MLLCKINNDTEMGAFGGKAEVLIQITANCEQ